MCLLSVSIFMLFTSDEAERRKCVGLSMDDLRFYILFNSISFISGRWADDNEGFVQWKPVCG